MEGFDAGAVFAKLQLQKGEWDNSVKSLWEDLKKTGDITEAVNVIMANFGKIAAGAAVAVTAAMTAAAVKTAEYAHEVYEMGQRTGIAVQTLSGLKLPADAGSSIEVFA